MAASVLAQSARKNGKLYLVDCRPCGFPAPAGTDLAIVGLPDTVLSSPFQFLGTDSSLELCLFDNVFLGTKIHRLCSFGISFPKDLILTLPINSERFLVVYRNVSRQISSYLCEHSAQSHAGSGGTNGDHIARFVTFITNPG